MHITSRADGPGITSLFLLWNIAVTNVYGYSGIGYPRDNNTPWEANSTQWQSLVAGSNATSRASLRGRDVSKPWPGDPMDGWVINMTAVDGLPKALAVDVRVVAPKTITKTALGVVDARNDWAFCAWRWFGSDTSKDSPINNPQFLDSEQDGSCTKWIPDSCIQAMEKWAQTAYKMVEDGKSKSPYSLPYTCNSIEIPKECQGVKGIEVGLPSASVDPAIPVQLLNGSTTWQNGFRQNGTESAQTVYQEWLALTRDFTAVLTTFGHVAEYNSTLGVDPGFSKLTCIRAKDSNANTNKTFPDKGEKGGNGGKGGKDDKTDGAVTLSDSLGWKLLACVASVMVAMSI